MPPLEEQRRIAEILDTIDETIQATERVITKHQRTRSGLASDLLSGMSCGAPLRETPFSEMSRVGGLTQQTPNGTGAVWKRLCLKDVAESIVDGPFGTAIKTEHYVQSGGVRVIRLANLGEGHFIHRDEVFIDRRYANALSRHEVTSGDVLVASLGDDRHRPGRACIYPTEFAPGVVKADCFRIRPSELIDSRFLREALNSGGVSAQVRRLVKGVTRDRVNLSELRGVVLPVPSLDEQRRIAAILETVDETVRADKVKLAKLRQLRSGLAADLLSGRVRTVAA